MFDRDNKRKDNPMKLTPAERKRVTELVRLLKKAVMTAPEY